MTRCKMRCTEVAKQIGWGDHPIIYAAKFRVVMPSHDGPSDENKKFFAATPSGEITLGTIRDDHFEVGRVYHVDFTPAD